MIERVGTREEEEERKRRRRKEGRKEGKVIYASSM